VVGIKSPEIRAFPASARIRWRVELLVAIVLTAEGIAWEYETIELYDPEVLPRHRAARPDFFLPVSEVFLEVKQRESDQRRYRRRVGLRFNSRQEELSLRAGYGFACISMGSPPVAAIRSFEEVRSLVLRAYDRAVSRRKTARREFSDWRMRRRFRSEDRTNLIVPVRREATG